MTDRARLVSIVLTSVILPMALLTAAMIGLGLLVTHVLQHVWPFTVEDHAVRALVAGRTPALDRVTDLISVAAHVVGISTALVVAGCTMRLAYHRWHESLFLAAAVLGQLAEYLLTSPVVARARPAVLQLDDFPPMRSFFSGHTSAAVALYGGIAVVLAMHARRRAHAAAWWVMLTFIPVAVAISRVYRGMHYPSDVVASFIVGFGCLWIMQRAVLAPAEPRGSRES
jgi:membrane-associated phospholipid phosphatase